MDPDPAEIALRVAPSKSKDVEASLREVMAERAFRYVEASVREVMAARDGARLRRRERLVALRHAATESAAQVKELQRAEAHRRWAYFRVVHSRAALQARLDENIFPLYPTTHSHKGCVQSHSTLDRVSASIRAHVTAGPVHEHFVSLNNRAVRLMVVAYEWHGKRVVFSCVDTSSEGFSSADGLMADFNVNPDYLEHNADSACCMFEFWACHPFLNAVDVWGLEARLKSSAKCGSLDTLLQDVPEPLWMLLLCLSARGGDRVGWLLNTDLSLSRVALPYKDDVVSDSEDADEPVSTESAETLSA